MVLVEERCIAFQGSPSGNSCSRKKVPRLVPHCRLPNLRTPLNPMNRRGLLLSVPHAVSFGSKRKCLPWSDLEMVDQITLSSNTPGSSNTLIFWLREVAAMRQAA